MKIAYFNAEKFASLDRALSVAASRRYIVNVLLGDKPGQYIVPMTTREESILVRGGYEVALKGAKK